MTAQGLRGGVHIVVLDPVLPAGLLHDGRDLGVVGLDDPGEEVVCGLMVEGSSEDCPEPAPCGIVLSGGYLQLSPAASKNHNYYYR